MTPETPTLFRAAGMVLGASTVLSLLLVAMHPAIHAAPAGEVLNQLVRSRTLDGIVHGSLIALMIGFLFAFTGFAIRVGLGRGPVLLGLIAYGVGVVATIGAAVIDGFVGPAFAAHVPADQATVAVDILIFASAAIQYLTKLGFIGLSVGILAGSVPLLGDRGLGRATGLLGMVAGALPAVFILAVDPGLDPHALIMILLVQAIWNIAAAALLLRGGQALAPQPA